MIQIQTRFAILLQIVLITTHGVHGFVSRRVGMGLVKSYPTKLSGVDEHYNRRRSAVIISAVAGADIDQDTDEETPQVVGDKIIYRGKVNEIDYCIAPADVSLSRAYGQQQQQLRNESGESSTTTTTTTATAAPPKAIMSLTQALNNASNRAVRRILLAKCWPSEEALNKSLRLAAAAEKQAQEDAARRVASGEAKCPVPRPILNLLMRRGASGGVENSKEVEDDDVEGSSTTTTTSSSSSIKVTKTNNGIGGPYTTGSSAPPPPPTELKTRTNEQYVQDQISAFRDRYGTLEGYDYAEAYLESILSLATTGKESSRIKDVLDSNVYDESYRRVMSVLKSVGVVLEDLPGTDRFQIANKLVDQNFCLSVIDILNIEKNSHHHQQQSHEGTSPLPVVETIAPGSDDEKTSPGATDKSAAEIPKKKNPLQFWKKGQPSEGDDTAKDSDVSIPVKTPEKVAETTTKTGGVVLCADEPTMTRQLNALSNIVHRGLLYGGDQELLVLSETLADNSATFVKKWYPDTGRLMEDMEQETRPGVQYLNSLICLLRQAHVEGIVTTLDPIVPLSQSYANSFERLMASLVEMGSGYVKPEPDDVLSMPKPRTAQEELGRFAVWETNFRSKGDETTPYPDDLEGTWEVRDEVSGETIGTSKVVFLPQGDVSVAPPLQGLRWRLDPGPTHLDTCTFQVLSEDGMILQYRGFIDRGARLEARFSKRPTKIRGSVMFQMRYGGSNNYWKDMMPVNYKAGGTKFVMTKRLKESENSPFWKNV